MSGAEEAAPLVVAAAPSPFTRAMLSASGSKISLREYALAYLRHHDVLKEGSRANHSVRKAALLAMSATLKVGPNKVRSCMPHFRMAFYQCMVESARRAGSGGAGGDVLAHAPVWARLLEERLRVLPRALEEVSVHRACGAGAGRGAGAARLSPAGALRLIVAYCRRHRSLCSSQLYAELRQALRCAAPSSELHAVWVSAQRVCAAQLAARSRAGDAPARAPMSRAAARVADLVLTYTDVDAHRVLTDESVTLYDELQALSSLFALVQKHGVQRARGAAQLGPRWSAVHREYVASGKQTSIVVLQRRWHELKLQTRARLVAYWRDRRSRPAPALLHVDVATRFPNVLRKEPVSWRQLVADGLVIMSPLEEELCEDSAAAAADSDASGSGSGKPSSRAEPADNQDDDVQLIEKKVETIDVDSGSDTEDRLVIDVPAHELDPTQDQRQIDTKTSMKGNTSPSNDVPNEGTSKKPFVIAPTLVRQLINVASVESINNRFQESINNLSASNTAQTDEVAIPNDTATAGTSTENDIDTGQTLAILQKLDPSKVCTEIIYESDSDDDLQDNKPYSMSVNDQNTPNETQISISNVTPRPHDSTVTVNVEKMNQNNPNTSVSDGIITNNVDKETSDGARAVDAPNTDTTNINNNGVEAIDNSAPKQQNDPTKETVHASIDANVNSATETKQTNAVNTIAPAVNSDVTETDRPLNGDSEDVTMQVAAANSGSGDTIEATVGTVNSKNDNVVAMDVNIKTRDANSESENYIIKKEVNDAPHSFIENGIVASGRIKVEKSDVAVSEAGWATRGSESYGLEDDNKEIEEHLVDPKLIMETRVNIVRLHDTHAWRLHAKRNSRIDIHRLNMAALQPALNNNEKVLIQIEINGIVKSENLDNSDATPAADTDELVHEDSYSSTGDSSSGEEFVLADSRRSRCTARGAKHSLASGVLEWSANYEKAFAGRARRMSSASRRRERVAKRVQLPDIEEVRRVNSSILTAQVAPLTAADTLFDEEDTLSDDTIGMDIPADEVVGTDMQADLDAGMDIPADQVVGTDLPGEQVAGTDLPGEQAAGANSEQEWPDGQVPSRRELADVLNQLSFSLRQRGLLCGLPAPEYCCAARRHRSVNDARRRICASAPEIQLHVHAGGAGACACCCRHVLEEAGLRARLAGDVTRLAGDLRRLLHAAPTGNSTSKQASNRSKKASSNSKQTSDGSSRKDKKRRSRKKSKQEPSHTEQPEDTSHTEQLAEWERQKSLNAQYFHINTGTNRKRRRASTEQDDSTEPTPTDATTINSIHSSPHRGAEGTDQGTNTEGLKNVIPERGAASVKFLNTSLLEIAPSKSVKVSTWPARSYSVVVTKLKKPQNQFHQVVKLAKPYSSLKPGQLTPVITSVGSLSNSNMVAHPGRLVPVPSSATSGLAAVPSSAAGFSYVPSGKLKVLNSVASVSALSGGLVSVPSSVASLCAEPSPGVATAVVPQANITERPNHVPHTPGGDIEPLVRADASEPPGVALSQHNTTNRWPSATCQISTPAVRDNDNDCDIEKKNIGVEACFVDKVTVENIIDVLYSEQIRDRDVYCDTAPKSDFEKIHCENVENSVEQLNVEMDNTGEYDEKYRVRDDSDDTAADININKESGGVAMAIVDSFFKNDSRRVCSKKNEVGNICEATKNETMVSFIDKGNVEMECSEDAGKKSTIDKENNVDSEKSNTGDNFTSETSNDCILIDDDVELVILDSDDEKDNSVTKNSLIISDNGTRHFMSDDTNVKLKAESSTFVRNNDDDTLSSILRILHPDPSDPPSKIHNTDNQNLSVYDQDDCMLYTDNASDRIQLLVDKESDGFSDKKLRSNEMDHNKTGKTKGYKKICFFKENEATHKDPTKSSEGPAIKFKQSNTDIGACGHRPAAVAHPPQQWINVNRHNHLYMDEKSSEIITFNDCIGLSGGVVKIKEVTPACAAEVPIAGNLSENISPLRTYANKTKTATEITDLPKFSDSPKATKSQEVTNLPEVNDLREVTDLPDGAPISVKNNDILSIDQEITTPASTNSPLEPCEDATCNSTEPSDVTANTDIIDISEDSSDDSTTYVVADSNIKTSETTMPVLVSSVSLAKPNDDAANSDIIDISDDISDDGSAACLGDSDTKGVDTVMPVIVSAVSLATPSHDTVSDTDELASLLGQVIGEL